METVLLLVAVAGLSAAVVWWSMSRPHATRGPETLGPAGAPREGGDFFVLHPSDAPAAREDRPPPARSLARIALAVAVVTVLLVAAVWVIGLVVKLQLDRYFTTGG